MLDWPDVAPHQLAAWFMHTPLERFLIATRRIQPHAPRMKSDDERNSAMAQLIEMDATLTLPALQDLSLAELELACLGRADIRAARLLAFPAPLRRSGSEDGGENATSAATAAALSKPFQQRTTADIFRDFAIMRNVHGAKTLAFNQLRNVVVQSIASLADHSVAMLQVRIATQNLHWRARSFVRSFAHAQ
jgi:hypothetical protein